MALIKNENNLYTFFCPACNKIHSVDKNKYAFNGDLNSPVLYPFINNENCCLFVRHGYLIFTNNSTHELKGTRVPMVDF